jgi:hypothetical protein
VLTAEIVEGVEGDVGVQSYADWKRVLLERKSTYLCVR